MQTRTTKRFGIGVPEDGYKQPSLRNSLRKATLVALEKILDYAANHYDGETLWLTISGSLEDES